MVSGVAIYNGPSMSGAQIWEALSTGKRFVVIRAGGVIWVTPEPEYDAMKKGERIFGTSRVVADKRRAMAYVERTTKEDHE